jgi:DNA-binding CsgD family transcriptional regulator
MARRTADSLLSALGLSAEQERLYQRLAPHSGSALAAVATRLSANPDELARDLRPLEERGLVVLDGDWLRVVPLSGAISTMIMVEAESAAKVHERLDHLSRAIPYLTAATVRPGPGEVSDVSALEGEVSSGGNALKLLTSLIENSRGDLLWLRPDTWRVSRENAITAVVAGAVESGRRSRAIYPVLALQEAPDVLRARAQAGEEVRLLADLPTRMMIIGSTHVVLPEPLGYADEPRLLIRQPAIVESLTMLFESMWERATPVPDLEHGRTRTDRRFLLHQLASGAKDEQIARALGISLRTVRRRVAELLDELQVQSRFQAGVEAVRRGLL